MNIESFDITNIEKGGFELIEKVKTLSEGFESKIKPLEGNYLTVSNEAEMSLQNFLGIEQIVNPEKLIYEAYDGIKNMYDGIPLEPEGKTVGLKEISEYTINPEYREQCINQHAGFSAEVISTTKENLIASQENTGVTTYRTDDLAAGVAPEDYGYKRNDPYVDKVRIKDGQVVETVQTKFVGKDGADCLSKLASKKYDKYFEEGKVDKIEIPQEHYDQIKNEGLIDKRIDKLSKQLERVTEEGNTEAQANIESQIEKYKLIDEKIERSTVSKDEARYATEYPERYTTKTTGIYKEMLKVSEKQAEKAGLTAAGITLAISTVDNYVDVMNGEKTVEQAFVDVAKQTGTAGLIGYGTGFVSTSVSIMMSQSSHQLLRETLGNANVVGAVVSFGIESYDEINDFATGVIDANELAYDLGENAVGIGGSIIGSSIAGATVGSIGGPVGTVLGFGAGLAGGMVGYAVTTELYQTAVEAGTENVDVIVDKAQSFVDSSIELAKAEVPAHVDNIKASINDYAKQWNIPIHV